MPSLLFKSLAVVGVMLLALQANSRPLSRASSIDFSTLSATDIASFKPFSFYASTAYCQPSEVQNWSCGWSCNANPAFKPVASGGDGNFVQFWYVGFDPTLQTVIVGHQGTDTSKIMPLLTDGDFFLTKLDQTLFPGMSPSVKVHDGFKNEHAQTATQILAAVKTALQQSSLNKVTVVGHSLGAALALLDSVYLALSLPNVTLSMIGYGLPRVGNQAFATYVDGHINVTHVNNKDDPIPTIPPRFLGFHHPQGEIHIQADNLWIACPGEDNTDPQCSLGDISNIVGNEDDHDGPYDGVEMGC